MTNPQVQYWDSCLFIRFLMEPQTDKDRDQLARVEPLFAAAHRGELRVVVSTMVLAEIRPREPYNQKHLAIIDDLLYRGRANPRVVAVTPPIAREASALGAVHGRSLTTPDALHVATALLERAAVMYTFDGDTDNERRRSGKLLGFNGLLGSPRLPILVPPEPPKILQGSLLELLQETTAEHGQPPPNLPR